MVASVSTIEPKPAEPCERKALADANQRPSFDEYIYLLGRRY